MDALLDSWKIVRQDTAQAVEDMPDAEMDFKPVPEVMTFREIARHILASSYAISGILLDGLEKMDRQELMKRFPPVPADAGAAWLASELRARFEERLPALAAQPPEFYAGMVTRFDGQRVTRLEMLQFAKEHELTHRAQLFLYQRLKGIVPVTTRRRQAAK
ncbi:MAG TPA: DinB family protein [Bryobacteraceae bacterium]|nr:DinB family protein [Bryobacteraceae bacterium]